MKSYCPHCGCSSCLKKSIDQYDRRQKADEVAERKVLREAKKHLLRTTTVREKHFQGVKFRHGFLKIKFNSPAVRILSVRCLNALLHWAKVETVEDVLNMSAWKLLKRTRNFGPTSFRELLEFIKTGIKS